MALANSSLMDTAPAHCKRPSAQQAHLSTSFCRRVEPSRDAWRSLHACTAYARADHQRDAAGYTRFRATCQCLARTGPPPPWTPPAGDPRWTCLGPHGKPSGRELLRTLLHPVCQSLCDMLADRCTMGSTSLSCGTHCARPRWACSCSTAAIPLKARQLQVPISCRISAGP